MVKHPPQQHSSFVKVFCTILFILPLMSCSDNILSSQQPTSGSSTIIQTTASTGTFTPTLTFTVPSATPTTSLTPYPTLSPTVTPTPGPRQVGSFGQGVMSDIFYSPDGQVIAVGVENTLHWFNASTFKEIGSLRLGFERIYTLAFSPDNQFVGVGSGVSKAQIVDLGHQTILATDPGTHRPCVRSHFYA